MVYVTFAFFYEVFKEHNVDLRAKQCLAELHFASAKSSKHFLVLSGIIYTISMLARSIQPVTYVIRYSLKLLSNVRLGIPSKLNNVS